MSSGGLPLRLTVVVAVLVGLALTGRGLTRTVYFERTPSALAGAERGNLLIVVGCLVLLLAAGLALGPGPRWAALLIALPVVVCGGLALVASETLFPQIAALPTFGAALVGAVAVAVTRV